MGKDDGAPAAPGRFPERELIPYEPGRFEAAVALVLAPHPDDEVFGCGAAISSLRSRGVPVHVLVVSDGAGDELDEAKRQSVEEARLSESRAALALLGGATLHRGGFPDRGLLDRTEEVSDALSALLARLGPDLVFAPSPVEIHPDHRGVAAALLSVARRPTSDPGATVLSRARVAFFEISQPIRPNFLLDATPFLGAKDQAMEAFASQNLGRPYPDLVRGLMSYRRMTLGPEVAAAEAYFVVPGEALRMTPDERLRAVLGPSIPPGEMLAPSSRERSLGQRLRGLAGFRGRPG